MLQYRLLALLLIALGAFASACSPDQTPIAVDSTGDNVDDEGDDDGDDGDYTFTRSEIFAGSEAISAETDGIGTDARFVQISSLVATDTHVLVADPNVNNIRVVFINNSEVSTPAFSEGDFVGPQCLGISGDFLYVGENDQTIVRMHLDTGAMELLAGNAGTSGYNDAEGISAEFDDIRGITAVGDGRYNTLYIADRGNHVIRKAEVVEISDLVEPDMTYVNVTTFAGNQAVPGSSDGIGGAAGFVSPSGILNDGTYLYVIDSGNHTLRRIQISNQDVVTVVGVGGSDACTDGAGTSARLDTPTAISSDDTHFYVADDCGIRKIDKVTFAVSTMLDDDGSPLPAGDSLVHTPYGIFTESSFALRRIY